MKLSWSYFLLLYAFVLIKEPVQAAISPQGWSSLRNELMKQSHELYDDVRTLSDVWNRHLEHPSENPEEVKNKVTTSLRAILLPEAWKLRLKILELPTQLPTASTTGQRPTDTSEASISGSGSASIGTGRPPAGTGIGQVGNRPPNTGHDSHAFKPEGLSLNGGIRVEAPFLSKLLGILW